MDAYRGKYAIFDGPYAIDALSGPLDSKAAATAALRRFKKSCTTAIVGYCMTDEELAKWQRDREARLKDSLRAVFPEGPAGDDAAMIIVTFVGVNDWLDDQGCAGIKYPVQEEHKAFDETERAKRALRRKALKRLRSQLEKLPALIDSVRESLERLDVQINDGPKTNMYLETMWCVKVMVHGVDRASQFARPPRDSVWHLAVSMRTCLELAEVKLGATLSGAWAKGVRIMLAYLYPHSADDDLEEIFRSIKRRWDRDRTKTVVPKDIGSIKALPLR